MFGRKLPLYLVYSAINITKIYIPIIVPVMQSAQFQKFNSYQTFDNYLSPRSVSSRSNPNINLGQYKNPHRINHQHKEKVVHKSYRHMQPKNCFSPNNMKDFVIRPKDKQERNNFQLFPTRTLKRYDSNKLNDIGKYKKQLTRSKSVREIQQKSRIQILGHIQKILQDGTYQDNHNFHGQYTETYQPKSYIQQNISNRISRLQQYLFKIKRERQRQKIKAQNQQSLEQNRNIQSQQNKQKTDQNIKYQEETRRIQKMKFLIEKLEEVKRELFELKHFRQVQQSIPGQNYINPRQNFQNSLNSLVFNPKYEQSQQNYRHVQLGPNLTGGSAHNYPPSVAKFKYKMQGTQLKLPVNQQNKLINQGSNNPLTIGRQKDKQVSLPPTKPKISFTFGSRAPPTYVQPSSSGSTKVSPILILD